MCKDKNNKNPEFAYYKCDNKYFVKYMEADCNWYRTPTKWEKFKLSVRSTLKSVFVLPFTWLYQAFRCWGCQLKCKKEVQIINLENTNALLNERIRELENQNSIFRSNLNDIWAAESKKKEKKKAAKKRPSSKKRKAT